MLVLQKLAYGQAFIGIVTNWDNIEKIIKESFKTLGVDPKDTPVLITESAQNVNANREKWIQLLFESFEIPSFYVASQPYLSLAAIVEIQEWHFALVKALLMQPQYMKVFQASGFWPKSLNFWQDT